MSKKVVLDKAKAEQIAEEVGILRQDVVDASNWLDAVERQMKISGGLDDLHIKAIGNLNRAKAAENEFYRALYIIGVVGVNFVDLSDQRYSFNLIEAIKAIEEEGGDK